MAADIRRIKEAVSKLEGYSDAKIFVEVLKDASVPGVTVFSADVEFEDDDIEYVFGVASSDEISFDRARSMAIIARAWGYGPKRTVPATQVARVMALILSVDEPGDAYLSAAQIAKMPEDVRRDVRPPREIVVDGHPGVEFWAADGKTPYRHLRVVFRPDGSVIVPD